MMAIDGVAERERSSCGVDSYLLVTDPATSHEPGTHSSPEGAAAPTTNSAASAANASRRVCEAEPTSALAPTPDESLLAPAVDYQLKASVVTGANVRLVPYCLAHMPWVHKWKQELDLHCNPSPLITATALATMLPILSTGP